MPGGSSCLNYVRELLCPRGGWMLASPGRAADTRPGPATIQPKGFGC